MVDMHDNCTYKCLNYYSVIIAIIIGKPCFKSIKAIIGAYVVTPFKIINEQQHNVLYHTGFISHQIIPLVITSLGGTQTHTYTNITNKINSRNQVYLVQKLCT